MKIEIKIQIEYIVRQVLEVLNNPDTLLIVRIAESMSEYVYIKQFWKLTLLYVGERELEQALLSSESESNSPWEASARCV